jgi:hypothetical protein
MVRLFAGMWWVGLFASLRGGKGEEPNTLGLVRSFACGRDKATHD